MRDIFYLQLPLKKEYLTTIRLTAGGICSQADFGIDQIEDFKLCVSEGCLLLMRAGYNEVEIEFSIGGGASAVLTGANLGAGADIKDDMTRNFSITLLKELVSEVTFAEQANKLKQITLTLKR